MPTNIDTIIQRDSFCLPLKMAVPSRPRNFPLYILSYLLFLSYYKLVEYS